MRLVFAVMMAALVLPLAGCLDGTVPSVVPEGERLSEGVTQDPGWPALEDATIRPGVLVEAKSRTCPSNFLFARPDNTSLFLGIAAHCVQDMVVGEWVLVDPGRTDAPALLAYSSWQTMAELGVDDPQMLDFNDFAVLRLDPAFRMFAHPAIVRFGGPAAMGDADALDLGDEVVSYAEPDAGSPDLGAWKAVVTKRHDWGLLTYGAPPELPGRLGTGVMTPDGRAVGLTVSLGAVPDPASNGVARLDAVMAFALEHANLVMELQTWPLLESPGLAARVPPTEGSNGITNAFKS